MRLFLLLGFAGFTLPPGGRDSSQQLNWVRVHLCVCARACSSCSAHGEPLFVYCLLGCLCLFSTVQPILTVQMSPRLLLQRRSEHVTAAAAAAATTIPSSSRKI